MRRGWFISRLTAISLLTCITAFAQGEKTQMKGMIISRTGDAMIVSSSGQKTTVVLTDDTKTKDNKGLFGMRKEYMADTVLIPGLKVKVDGAVDDEGRIIAKTITVDGDDLETAEMIQAGLSPTAEQVADNAKDIQENTQRFSDLDDYDVKGEATAHFDVGSIDLSSEDQENLMKLAQAAIELDGYMIEVKGFTDSSGDAAMNQQLSEDRAEAVVGYLTQQCNVPVRRIMAPGAMGEYEATASNETAQGRAQNRRVEVKILINKGVIGKS